MFRHIYLTIGFCLSLAGAAQSQNTGALQPGPQLVDLDAATGLFTQVCIETLPKFAEAGDAIAALPFQQNPETGTYYHRVFDLSLSLQFGAKGAVCSMVFVSAEDPAQLALIISLAGAASADADTQLAFDPDTGESSVNLTGGARLIFRPAGQENGKNFYHAVIIAEY